MVDFWNRLLNQSKPEPAPPEPLNAGKIDAGYRMFWTRTAFTWDSARRTQIAQRVVAAIAAPGFEANALERRYRIDGLDDQAHSGASLLALVEVLRALDDYDAGEDAR